MHNTTCSGAPPSFGNAMRDDAAPANNTFFGVISR